MDLTGHLLYYQEGKHRINLNDYVQHNQLNKAMDTMNNSISEALKSKVDSITNITYLDLKNLRDNSQLIPGSLYRITNYNNSTDVTFDGFTSHQFDIILLALTPNTLAEEGWVAIHDNIYDVTFSDEVTKKCYINILNDNLAYIIDINTLIGTEVYTVNIDDYSELKTNEENKTAIVSIPSEMLLMENLPYNYFQNRNLSTWKVWYSLDNDTARFSWADDSVDLSTEEQIGILRPAGASGPSSPEQHYIARRDIELDVVVSNTNYYCWTTNYNMHYYTISENPTIGDTVYNYISSGQGEVYNSGNTVESYTPTHEGTGPNGRGVIYRITDESGELCKLQWQELKTIRDSKALVADTKYRIIDYQCTTTQENTQSAGHQFDIVLLALSEDKLAEEGWAMIHDGVTEFDDYDIYNITFTDDVTKQFYLKQGTGGYNVVDVETFKGVREVSDSIFDVMPDIETKTATMVVSSEEFINEIATEDFPYNYFQNSNLSAWKVWYCLDNDTARFAWADDSVDNTTFESIVVENTTYTRSPNDDDLSLSESLARYAWRNGSTVGYTINEHPDFNEVLFDGPGSKMHIGTITSYTPAHEGTGPNGRGVIYRLIDEFNNDIKYDFKNIQFKRTITDGQYDENGIKTWCYTLNLWYNDMCQDASIVGNTLPNDVGYINGVYDNVFGYTTAYDLYIEGVNTFAFALGNNVILSFDDDGYYGIYNNTIGNHFFNNTIGNAFKDNIIGNQFYTNTIMNDFVTNIIGNNFYLNMIGDGFHTNVIGNNFHTNKIKASFYFNMIGNGFHTNTIENTFYFNTIGNSFNDKTISNSTSYKNYGNNGVELATKDDLN